MAPREHTPDLRRFGRSWLVPYARVHFLRATPSFNVWAPTYLPERYCVALPRYVSASAWNQPFPALSLPSNRIPGLRFQMPALGLASYLLDSSPALQRRFRSSVRSDTQRTIPWTFTSTTLPTHGSRNPLDPPGRNLASYI